MIFHDNGIFLLKNDEFSYMFRVDKYGQLQHLHFGVPVSEGDADAFAVIPGPGWGSNIVLDDADPNSCPDFVPLEWSNSGRGDYRESPLELGRATDLRYVNHNILEGPAPFVCTLPQAKGNCETLELILEHTETEPEPCLSVSCRGTGHQWTAAGAGALGAADLGMA